MYFVSNRTEWGGPQIGYIMQVASSRPLIGLLSDRRLAAFGAWSDVDLCFAWTHYVEAITAAGGAAVIFPPEQWLADDPATMLDAVDGLLLTGGRDIDASVYGAVPHPANEPGDAHRDRVELALARAALETEIPILGVCRGMQILNVVTGGGIEQHLPDPEGVHRGPPGTFVAHEVDAADGSRLAGIFGAERFVVRSHHHQGLAELGDGVVATGHAPDGVVEAIELPGERFCLAVLWHPEEDLDGGGGALYGALVAACSERIASGR